MATTKKPSTVQAESQAESSDQAALAERERLLDEREQDLIRREEELSARVPAERAELETPPYAKP